MIYFSASARTNLGRVPSSPAVWIAPEAVGKGWLLNGQKIWTTNVAKSDYMIALLRTSGELRYRHSRLSHVIVNLRLLGVDIRPIYDLTGDEHFAEVFFDDVELGSDSLIGEEGRGWQQVGAELAYERSRPECIYTSTVLFDGQSRHLRKMIGRMRRPLGSWARELRAHMPLS